MRTCVPFELRIVKGKGERFLGWLFCPRWGPGDTEKDTATEYKEPSNQCRLLDHGHLPPNHILGPRKENYAGIGPVTPANAPANGGMPRNLEVTLPYFGNLKSHFRYVPALRRKRCDASGLSLTMHARRGKMRIPVRLTSSTRTGGREAVGSAHLFTPISPSRPGQGGGGPRFSPCP